MITIAAEAIPAIEAFLAQPDNHALVYDDLPIDVPPLMPSVFEDLFIIVEYELGQPEPKPAARRRFDLLNFIIDTPCPCGNCPRPRLAS